MRSTAIFAITLCLAPLAVAREAAAQERYAEDATDGLALPAAALAGDQDATAVALDPGGLVFLQGRHVELAVTALQPDEISAAGAGFGLYAATPVKLPLLPRLGFGVAAEKLLPPRVALATDPGEPIRLSFAAAYAPNEAFGVGLAWRRFLDANGGALDGVDTFDLGVSLRFGATWAAGAVVRDLFSPAVAGVPAQRRYDAELIARPFGTDRLEIGIGSRIGERRLDVDPRLRFSVRIARGAWLKGDVQARTLWRLDDPAFGAGEATRVWDVRGTLGFEVSFGEFGAALYATAGGGESETALFGGSAVIRWSSDRLPSVVPSASRIERIKLEGSLDERSLTRVILRLRKLERDDGVKAVFLVIDGVGVGFGGIQELRDAVFRLRERGKKVFAYLMAGGTRDYYVAAAADKIYLDAAGGVRLMGLGSTLLYFKDLFDKLGVVAQFEKIDEYKTAPESFIRDAPSDEAKEMRAWLFDDLYLQMIRDLSRDRAVLPDEMKKLIDGGPYTAAEAAKAKLVDASVEPAEVDALVVKEMGRAYALTDGLPPDRPDAWERPQLAIVYIDGDIVDGKSMTIPLLGTRLTGGDTIAQSIAWARANPRVQAIVLRIDSPGGSALASEVISREVFKTRGVKPIIVSMGDIAASGGYFAAAGGDLIYAEPSTLTGSIGIFTGKFDLSGLLHTLGFTWSSTTRGAHADMESMFRPYTDEERAAIKSKLTYFYDRFRTAVSNGRAISMDDVDKVGRGRVWTGNQAKQRKLIDRIGGLADAVLEAKSRAGYGEDEPLEVVMLPAERDSLLNTLLRLGGNDTAGDSARVTIIDDLWRLVPGSLLVGRSTPQARLPFVIIDE